LSARATAGVDRVRSIAGSLIGGYLLAVIRAKACTRERYSLELLAIPLAFVVLHVGLYPLYENRQFVLPASLILVWILGAVRGVVK
jgi:hypothetical protein